MVLFLRLVLPAAVTAFAILILFGTQHEQVPLLLLDLLSTSEVRRSSEVALWTGGRGCQEAFNMYHNFSSYAKLNEDIFHFEVEAEDSPSSGVVVTTVVFREHIGPIVNVNRGRFSATMLSNSASKNRGSILALKSEVSTTFELPFVPASMQLPAMESRGLVQFHALLSGDRRTEMGCLVLDSASTRCWWPMERMCGNEMYKQRRRITDKLSSKVPSRWTPASDLLGVSASVALSRSAEDAFDNWDEI